MTDIKVVQFKNGQYAVRKGSRIYEYYWPGIFPNWISKDSNYIGRCLMSKEKACEIFFQVTMDTGTPVDCNCEPKWSSGPIEHTPAPWYKFWSKN